MRVLARVLARVCAIAPPLPQALCAAALPALVAGPCWALSLWLAQAHGPTYLLLQAVALYLCMGFGRDLHFARAIGGALIDGETEWAGRLLGEWRPAAAAPADGGEIARLAAENALISAHRDVFGVSFWFAVLPGPTGALVYHFIRFMGREWSSNGAREQALASVAERALRWLDWLPVRLTGSAFAAVGNFEDAVYCWRTQAWQWDDPGEGILIAAGAGAIGVRLGLAIRNDGDVVERPEMGTGDAAGAEVMQGIIGLVWRALVLCLLLLALFVIAAQVGG